MMAMFPTAKFVLQTNGTLLNKLPVETLLRLDCILISIDGDADATDRNRGEGTYNKIVANACDIRAKGYRNDLVARMTISDGSDIYTDVMHLLNIHE